LLCPSPNPGLATHWQQIIFIAIVAKSFLFCPNNRDGATEIEHTKGQTKGIPFYSGDSLET
jgi:hypothetical protein